MPNTHQQGANELGSAPIPTNEQAVTKIRWDLGQETHMLPD